MVERWEILGQEEKEKQLQVQQELEGLCFLLLLNFIISAEMKKKLSAISSLTFGLFKLTLVVLASLIGNSQPIILIGSLLNCNIIFPSPNVGFFSLISSSI